MGRFQLVMLLLLVFFLDTVFMRLAPLSMILLSVEHPLLSSAGGCA
jgi:hypothetical protein